MKKLLTLIVVVLFVGFAGIATAGIFTPTGPTPTSPAQNTYIGTGQTIQVSPSSNVQIIYDGAPSDYAAVSGHTSGDKRFGTGNTVPAVYFQIKTSGSYGIDLSTCLFDTTGWTAQ